MDLTNLVDPALVERYEKTIKTLPGPIGAHFAVKMMEDLEATFQRWVEVFESVEVLREKDEDEIICGGEIDGDFEELHKALREARIAFLQVDVAHQLMKGGHDSLEGVIALMREAGGDE